MSTNNNIFTAAWEDAFRAGFYAGFRSSAEGFNGEYPFMDKGLPVHASKTVNKDLKEAMAREQQAAMKKAMNRLLMERTLKAKEQQK